MKNFPIFYECIFGKTATYVLIKITERSQYWACFTDSVLVSNWRYNI